MHVPGLSVGHSCMKIIEICKIWWKCMYEHMEYLVVAIRVINFISTTHNVEHHRKTLRV